MIQFKSEQIKQARLLENTSFISWFVLIKTTLVSVLKSITLTWFKMKKKRLDLHDIVPSGQKQYP